MIWGHYFYAIKTNPIITPSCILCVVKGFNGGPSNFFPRKYESPTLKSRIFSNSALKVQSSFYSSWDIITLVLPLPR